MVRKPKKQTHQWVVYFVDRLGTAWATEVETAWAAIAHARDSMLAGRCVTGIRGPDGRTLYVDFIESGTKDQPWVIVFADRVTGWICASTLAQSREQAIRYAHWLTGEGCIVTGIFDPAGKEEARGVPRCAEDALDTALLVATLAAQLKRGIECDVRDVASSRRGTAWAALSQQPCCGHAARSSAAGSSKAGRPARAAVRASGSRPVAKCRSVPLSGEFEHPQLFEDRSDLPTVDDI